MLNGLLPLYIQGLFDLTTSTNKYFGGSAELAAAQLATHHVNQQKIVPGYQLLMHINDSKCDSGVGVDAFFHAIYTKRPTVLVLGPGCSHVTAELAHMVTHWNLLQVSHAATTPILSDRATYPLFFRTVAPDSSHNEGRRALIKKFKWDTIAVISQDDDLASLGTNNLITELEQANISVGMSVDFLREDYQEQMKRLKRSDLRIIIGSFSRDMAKYIFCQAYHLNMYGPDYVWLLQESLTDLWWENITGTNCTITQLEAATNGFLAVKSYNVLISNRKSISGLTYSEFRREFSKVHDLYTDTAVLAYDAVWVLAMTLRQFVTQFSKTENLDLNNFTYDNRQMAWILRDVMSNITFQGLSGPLSFRGSDRVGLTAFYQKQGKKMKKVAVYIPETGKLNFKCPHCQEIIWGGNHIPVAKREFKLRIVTVNHTAFIITATLVIIGIILALSFLAFNICYCHLRFIKLSSPHFNNMTIIGCLMVYSAIILLGLDHATLPTGTEGYYSIVCYSRAFLLSSGFSLAFGSMFLKTYRVHQIFLKSQTGVLKNKILKDHSLIPMVCVLLVIDCTILGIWIGIDPLQRKLRNLLPEISEANRSVAYVPQVEECSSQHINKWLVALYVYKGLFLAIGLYMAWETRHVSIPALNDSKYIGLCVYNVVIASCSIVAIANLNLEQKTLCFIIVAGLVFASTSITLCLLFVPKILLVWKSGGNEPVFVNKNLKVKNNTRRFITDDNRESYYRAQVQNRVFLKELRQLQQAAKELADQLEQD